MHLSHCALWWQLQSLVSYPGHSNTILELNMRSILERGRGRCSLIPRPNFSCMPSKLVKNLVSGDKAGGGWGKEDIYCYITMTCEKFFCVLGGLITAFLSSWLHNSVPQVFTWGKGEILWGGESFTYVVVIARIGVLYLIYSHKPEGA